MVAWAFLVASGVGVALDRPAVAVQATWSMRRSTSAMRPGVREVVRLAGTAGRQDQRDWQRPQRPHDQYPAGRFAAFRRSG